MEQSVIDNANRIVGSDNRDFEGVLEKLEATRQELEEEKQAAQLATQRANELQRKAQSEKDKIDVLRERELEKAKREAEKLINQAKQQSSNFLLELEKLKKEQNSSNATEIAKKNYREGISGEELVVLCFKNSGR